MEIFDKNLTFCTTFHKLVYVNLYINKVQMDTSLKNIAFFVIMSANSVKGLCT